MSHHDIMGELTQLPGTNDVLILPSTTLGPCTELKLRNTSFRIALPVHFLPPPRVFRNIQIEGFCTKRVLSNRRKLLIA